MNRATLRELGFELGARAETGESGAWFATAPDGTPVVLKWFPDESVADRYAVLLPLSPKCVHVRAGARGRQGRVLFGRMPSSAQVSAQARPR